MAASPAQDLQPIPAQPQAVPSPPAQQPKHLRLLPANGTQPARGLVDAPPPAGYTGIPKGTPLRPPAPAPRSVLGTTTGRGGPHMRHTKY